MSFVLVLGLASNSLADLDNDPCLIAWYEFEGNANDSSNNGLHGTEKGNPTYGSGAIGQAIVLDGDGDYVDISDPCFNYITTEELTISAWVKREGIPGSLTEGAPMINTAGIVVKGYDEEWDWSLASHSFHPNQQWYPGKHNRPEFGCTVNGNWSPTTGGYIDDGNWHHVAGVYNGEVVHIYVDHVGDELPRGFKVRPGTISTSAAKVVIGTDFRGEAAGGAGNCWQGRIDEVRIYDRALHRAEIAYLAGNDYYKAWNPKPSNHAVCVGADVVLEWNPAHIQGTDVVHNVYFGEQGNVQYVDCQEANEYDPGGLVEDKTYCWRIDEVEGTCESPGDVHVGDEWCFTVGPLKAWDPVPPNCCPYVDVDANLCWRGGLRATQHDVYFGTDPTPDITEFQVTIPCCEQPCCGLWAGYDPCAPGDMDYGTDYYWQIDEVNVPDACTWTGDVWHFRTIDAPRDPNLVAWWKLVDEGSDTLAFDASGNLHTGTFHGDKLDYVGTNKTGRKSGALEFGGSSDFVDCSRDVGVDCEYDINCVNDVDFDITGDITVAAWIKMGKKKKDCQAIITKGDSAWRLQRNKKKDVIEFAFTYDDKGDFKHVVGDVDVDDCEWHHVVGVYDVNYVDDKGTLFLYVDGQLDKSEDLDDAKTIHTNNYDVYIGENSQRRGREWNGLISDVRVYKRALSEDEIRDDLYLPTFDILVSYNHYPDEDAKNVPVDVTLSWTAGVEAASHDVYFGTDDDDVEDANNTPGAWEEYKGNYAIDHNYYDPGILDLGKTYYWRIDEVNEFIPEPNLWEGKVRGFTVVDHLVVDDFESYTSHEDLKETWKEGGDATVTHRAIPHGGEYSMRIQYGDGNYYAEATADIAKLEIDPNWTASGIKALVLWFRGQVTPVINEDERLYVALEDASGKRAEVEYPDPNLQCEEWQRWDIDLQDFNDINDVSLASIEKISIGLGDGESPGGIGYVWFDDIRLYPSRCFDKYNLECIDRDYEEDDPDELYKESDTLKYTFEHKYRPWADFTPFSGKCVVDYEDLDVFTDQWLADRPMGLLNGDFESGLDNWTFYINRPGDLGGYGFGVTALVGDFDTSDGDNELEIRMTPKAAGDLNYGLYQVFRVEPNETYTVDANWEGDAGFMGAGECPRSEYNYQGWVEVLMFPIDDPTDEKRIIAFIEPGHRIDWLADNWFPIIAKHGDLYMDEPPCNIGEFGPESITDANDHSDCRGHPDRKGTNEVLATTPYMVVALKLGARMLEVEGTHRTADNYFVIDDITVTGPQAYRLADFDTDGDVDFKDYANFANKWLDETCWPGGICPDP